MPESAQARLARVSRARAAVITRSLPKRSASGPSRIWHRPYGKVKAATTTASAGMVVPKSLAMTCSSGSVMRMPATEMHPAVASRVSGKAVGAEVIGP